MSQILIKSVEELNELPTDSVVLWKHTDPEMLPQYVYVKKYNGLWLGDGGPTRDFTIMSQFVSDFEEGEQLILLHRGFEPTPEQLDAWNSI